MASRKGGAYEREICGTLSSWWSNGKYDDLFWRTAGSGGRATRRSKRTHGHHGDICATHPDGEPLIKLLTLEIKRGYADPRHSIISMIDRPPNAPAATQGWEVWHGKVVATCRKSGSVSWLLIHRRDKRRAVAYFPHNLLRMLKDVGCLLDRPPTFATFYFASDGESHTVHCLPLDDFLELVDPEDIRRCLKRCSKN